MKASDREMRKKEKLRVELLIATMHQKDDSILNRILLQRAYRRQQHKSLYQVRQHLIGYQDHPE